MNIVSGLAEGCDTIAHKACLKAHGKTIAILPSTLSEIYPYKNEQLAMEIKRKGGLLISEYYKKAANRYEYTRRFIDRDRLQAMFSKGIEISASYREGEGDSGSRHAMEKAIQYKLLITVMYNELHDRNNPKFGLNKDYIEKNIRPVNRTIINHEMVHFRIATEKVCSKQQQNML